MSGAVSPLRETSIWQGVWLCRANLFSLCRGTLNYMNGNYMNGKNGNIERRGRVINTPASYLGGPGFKSPPGD
jgi:hypothetical protein